EQMGRALRKNRELMLAVAGSDRPWRRGYAHYAADFALVHLNEHNRGEAKRWAFLAVRLSPFAEQGRAVRYLVESVLPEPVYQLGRSTLKRFGVRAFPSSS